MRIRRMWLLMQKNKYIFSIVSTIISNKFLQIFSVISLLVFGYFCSTLDTKSGYFEAFSMALTYQQFITLCFLPMIILSNILIINFFEKSSMTIIRFENKKKYLRELLKSVSFCNTLVFVVIIIVLLTFFNFFSNGDLTIKYIESFKTTNIVYTIYIVIKLYILSIITSIVFTLLFKLFNKISALIISMGMASSLFICQWLDYEIVNKIYEIPVYIGIYFLDIIEYATFSLNVSAFLVMITCFALIIFVLFNTTIKFMKAVGD